MTHAADAGTARPRGAGLKPVNIRRLYGKDRDRFKAKVVIAYDGGKSIRAISRETTCSYGTIHTILVKSGTPLRPRGRHQSASTSC